MDTNPPSKIPNEATRQWAHDLLTPRDDQRVESDEDRADRRDHETESFLNGLFSAPRRVDALEGTDLVPPDLTRQYKEPQRKSPEKTWHQRNIERMWSTGNFIGTAGIEIVHDQDKNY